MSIFSRAQRIYTQRGWRRAAQFYWNAMRAGQTSHDWFKYLEYDFPATIPAEISAGLTAKIFRPYLRPRLNATRRAEILRAHYDLYGAKIAADKIPLLLEQPGMRLAQLTGKSGATYSIYLGASTTKEGDADIFYMDDRTGAPLATLTGVFGPDGFYIGGLRGIKPPLGKAEIVFATRDMHGLRPKHAALHAVCAIARWFGAAQIIAPTQRNHITHRSFGKFGFHSREILADYDAFWQEFTEARRADGDYILPLELPRRDAAEVKSKKRGEWLKRQGYLDDMAAQVAETLKSLAK